MNRVGIRRQLLRDEFPIGDVIVDPVIVGCLDVDNQGLVGADAFNGEDAAAGGGGVQPGLGAQGGFGLEIAVGA